MSLNFPKVNCQFSLASAYNSSLIIQNVETKATSCAVSRALPTTRQGTGPASASSVSYTSQLLSDRIKERFGVFVKKERNALLEKLHMKTVKLDTATKVGRLENVNREMKLLFLLHQSEPKCSF